MNTVYFTTKVNVASFRIRLDDDSVFSQYDILELRRSEIKSYLSYEREIYDFLWFGTEFGVRSNLNFSLSNSLYRRGDTLVEGQVDIAPFVNFSIFLVPPRKFLD